MKDKLEAQRREFQLELDFLNRQKSQMSATLEQIDSQAEIQNKLVRSSQNIEAVTAFFEKREPNFKD